MGIQKLYAKHSNFGGDKMKNSKHGISLIAVLMFMLAATTASIVVYKWIGSENFSSGARLKMSESEAASNSGLDAVQAWLENKAPDVGILLTDYLAQTANPLPPMLVDNSLLGTVGGNRNQNYQVYLIGADVTKRPYKMKFASVGTARDNSQNTQIAIFSVEGLYRLPVPNINIPGPFNQAFFGKVGTLTDGTEFSDAIINGDVGGNMPKITESLVVTGNATFMGGTSMTCDGGNEGELYIAGNLKPEGTLKVCGNAYVGSLELTSGTAGTFESDLYINNGATLGFDLTVGENFTINDGNLTIGQTAIVNIGGDFVKLNNSSQITFSDSRDFTVEGTSWIPGWNINVTANNRVTLNSNGEPLYADGTINSDGADGAGFNLYYKEGNTNTFRSKGTKASIPAAKPVEIKEASNLPHLRKRIEDGGGTVEDPIEAIDVDNWMIEAKKYPGLCGNVVKDADGNSIRIPGTGTNDDKVTLSDNGFNEDTFVRYINQCYEKLKLSNGLYNGYLPMIINNNNSKNIKGPFKGNFFFIFMGSTQFMIGPTTAEGKVMLYFPDETKGGPSGKVGIITKGSCASGETCEDIYNYFIFSERDMAGINNFPNITGSVFMAQGKKMDQIQGGTDITFNQDLYNSLVSAGVLGLTAAGQALADAIGQHYSTGNQDNRYTSLTPRLKVNVESRYTSTEILELNPNNKLGPAVLVMPRIVNLPKDIAPNVSPGHEIDDYFSVLYLNGIKESPAIKNRSGNWREERGTTQCVNSNGTIVWSNPLPEGDYLCEFTATGTNLKDHFFLRISGALGLSTIDFENSTAAIDEDDANQCVVGRVRYIQGSDDTECNPISVVSTNLPDGWSVQALPATNLSGDGNPQSFNVPNPMNNTYSSYNFTVCVNSTVSTSSVNFSISNLGGCAAGINQNFTVSRTGKVKADIKRVRDPALIGIPDCEGYDLLNPAKSANAWGAFTINPTPTCQPDVGKYEYKCNSPTSYDVSLILSPGFTLTSGCEFRTEPSINVGTSTPLIQIKADIKRKEYTLQINKLDAFSGTVTLTPNPEICLNLEGDCNEANNKLASITCIDSNCEGKIYAGVNYDVTIDQNALVSSIGLNRTGFLGTGRSGTIKVDDGSLDTKILNLNPLVSPNIICKLKSGGQITEGKRLGPSEFKYRLIGDSLYIKDNQGRCLQEDQDFNYMINGEELADWIPIKGTYQISVNVYCKENTIDGGINSQYLLDAPYQCEGNFEVVDEISPTIGCTWDNGANDYYVGDTPKVIVTIGTDPNGATVCNDLIVSSHNFGNLTNNWTKSGISSPYTITASSPLTDSEKGIDKSVTIEAACNRPSGNITLNVTCSGKTVKASQNCANIVAYCEWEGNGQTKFAGEPSPSNPPVITCCTSNVSGEEFYNMPPSVLSPGPYTVTAKAECGETTIYDIPCGILQVLNIPQISNCTGESNQEVFLPNRPILPTITLSDPSRVCSDDGQTPNNNWSPTTWTVSKMNDPDISGTWEEIFTGIGEYSFLSVSGKCGSYSGTLVSECGSWSATMRVTDIEMTNVAKSITNGLQYEIKSCYNTNLPIWCLVEGCENSTAINWTYGDASGNASCYNPFKLSETCEIGKNFTVTRTVSGNISCNNRKEYYSDN